MSEIQKIKANQLEEYHALKERQRELESEARALASKADHIGKLIKSAMEADNRQDLKRGSFRAVLETVNGRVSWKDECLKRLAPGELETIQASVQPSTRLVITAV